MRGLSAIVPRRGAIAGAVARALLGVVLAAAGCRSAPPASTPAAPHQVTYRLTWAARDIDAASDGSAWEVTTNLGYRVRVTRGWITTYSTELVECRRDATVPFATLAGIFVSAAEAGHSAGTPNPAAIRPMVVESLLDAKTQEAGSVTLAPQAYCQLHYLVARAGRDSPGLPTEIDMVDASLHVEGSYRAPGATTDAAFTVHTGSAYGQIFARVGDPPRALRVDTGRSALDVEIRRRRSRLFDGVDFASMPAKSAAFRMLQALVDGVVVEVRAVDANQ